MVGTLIPLPTSNTLFKNHFFNICYFSFRCTIKWFRCVYIYTHTQCVCVCVCVCVYTHIYSFSEYLLLCVWSVINRCNPMDCNPPGSSVSGDFPGKNTGEGCISYSRGSSQPRDWSWVSCVSNWRMDSFPLAPPLFFILSPIFTW